MKIAVFLLAAVAMIGFAAASASSDDKSNLKRIILASSDLNMNTQDLAFFLATHNYDVIPKAGYVKLRIDGQSYKAALDGNNSPEICDIKSKPRRG